MKQEAVLIFDIGKTNKKILLFDASMKLIHEEEVLFSEIPDDEGFPCEDLDALEEWMVSSCHNFMKDKRYRIKGINFSTYGASLVYLDGNGKRMTPLYNYLKPMPVGIADSVYNAFGGEEEFCRRTASPSLGMLNSGFQALWLKEKKPETFGKVCHILHFPQYLSFLLTGRISSELTSIGCHTGFWDFDRMTYHPWVSRLGETLPEPLPVTTTFPSNRFGSEVPVGIGIHDSSASLVPYLINSDEPFILISTGTWCISMNPFNKEPLTEDQLKKDCLQFLSIKEEPVKSSRFFLGHIHDVNAERLARHFGVGSKALKQVEVKPGPARNRLFFARGIPSGFVDETVPPERFRTFEEAYNQLVWDLVDLSSQSLQRIVAESDTTRNLYISGGFSKNPLFVRMLAHKFPDKVLYTSEIPNATSAGAALVLWNAIDPDHSPDMNLGLVPVAESLNDE